MLAVILSTVLKAVSDKNYRGNKKLGKNHEMGALGDQSRG